MHLQQSWVRVNVRGELRIAVTHHVDVLRDKMPAIADGDLDLVDVVVVGVRGTLKVWRRDEAQSASQEVEREPRLIRSAGDAVMWQVPFGIAARDGHNESRILCDAGGVSGSDAGSDKLNGGAGNDVIDGGDDNDSLIGSDGNDSLRGGNGNDSLNGGNGDDLLTGSAGDDRLFGMSGNDTLLGDSGSDILNGSAGIDIINPGPDTDHDIISDGTAIIDTSFTFDFDALLAGLL